jgi:hypothetical protein
MVAISFSISRPAFLAGDANLVDHLGELARTGRAHEIAGARVGRDHFLGARERLSIAAAHHRERAIFGAGLAARDRGVNEVEAAFFRLGVKFARDCSRSSRVIDQNGALLHAGESALRAQHHLAQIIVIADASHDEVLAFCTLFRCWRSLAAILCDPLVGLGGRAIVDSDVVPAFVLEVPRHRVTHDAKPEKRHLRHCACSLRARCRCAIRPGLCAANRARVNRYRRRTRTRRTQRTCQPGGGSRSE